MRESTRNWLAGCSVGCLLLLVVLVLAGYGTFRAGRQMIHTFEESASLAEKIADRHGEITDFTPEPTGRIAAHKIHSFLQVRQEAKAQRDRLEISLHRLSGDSSQPKGQKSNWLGKIYSGITFLPATADYIRARNQALLESEIGLGEYYYIYTLVFYVELGRSPADGPDFILVGGNRQGEMDEFEVREQRRSRILSSLNRLLLPALRNQLADLDSHADPRVDPEQRARLVAEIEKMENDRYRIPWTDGLPESISASLEPFLEELESSYAPMTNAIEISEAR